MSDYDKYPTLGEAVGIGAKPSSALAALRDDVASLTLAVQNHEVESKRMSVHLDMLRLRIKKLEDERNG